VTWTVVPILILVFIGAFSLPVLFKQQTIPEADVVVKATGYQWYWGYEYPEDMASSSDSFMLAEDQLAEYGYTRTNTCWPPTPPWSCPRARPSWCRSPAADVIHSWTIPAFGVKQDGVPGRLAELWFEVEPGRKASISASVRNCAARTTPTCRSPSRP
jgi:cytochrome c oxidase subunit 2